LPCSRHCPPWRPAPDCVDRWTRARPCPPVARMAERALRAGVAIPHGRGQHRARRLACRRTGARRSVAPHARARRREGLAAMRARVTVIERSRGITPRAFDRAGSGAADPLVLAKLAQLQDAARGRDAHGILELALGGELKGKTAVVSSFGAESAVLLHMVAE